MKKIIPTILSIILVFSACGKSLQYGVDVLHLDNFDFGLNIEQFFRDESIFRGKHDDFGVSSAEHYIDGDSIKMGYIQYSTTSMSQDRPLANYAGVKFESLGIITDEADEKVLMAIGSTDYATGDDVATIIDKLNQQYGEAEIRFSYEGINLLFRKNGSVANLFVGVRLNGYWGMWDESADTEMLTDEKQKEVKDKLKGQRDVDCTLFITKQDFDKALNESHSYSGDLTRYN